MPPRQVLNDRRAPEAQLPRPSARRCRPVCRRSSNPMAGAHGCARWLAGMSLAQLGDWRQARDGVFAVDALDEAEARHAAARPTRCGQLACCLAGDDAATLILIRSAAELLDEAAASRENAAALDERLAVGRPARRLRKVAEASAALQAPVTNGRRRWPGGPAVGDCAVAVAEPALSLCEKIEAGLSAIDEPRRSRIEDHATRPAPVCGQAAALAADGAELPVSRLRRSCRLLGTAAARRARGRARAGTPARRGLTCGQRIDGIAWRWRVPRRAWRHCCGSPGWPMRPNRSG